MSEAGNGFSIASYCSQAKNAFCRRKNVSVRGTREQQSQSSLPGLTRQSILFAKKFLRRRWTRGSSPRVTEELRRGTLPLTRPSP